MNDRHQKTKPLGLFIKKKGGLYKKEGQKDVLLLF
jgi:hypothetical protein